MKQNKTEMEAFVEDLYKDGKKPCERFGLTWANLADLEEKLLSLIPTEENTKE